MAQTNKMPNLDRSFSTKEPYNQWLFCGKSPATWCILWVFATLNSGFYFLCYDTVKHRFKLRRWNGQGGQTKTHTILYSCKFERCVVGEPSQGHKRRPCVRKGGRVNLSFSVPLPLTLSLLSLLCTLSLSCTHSLSFSFSLFLPRLSCLCKKIQFFAVTLKH